MEGGGLNFVFSCYGHFGLRGGGDPPPPQWCTAMPILPWWLGRSIPHDMRQHTSNPEPENEFPNPPSAMPKPLLTLRLSLSWCRSGVVMKRASASSRALCNLIMSPSPKNNSHAMIHVAQWGFCSIVVVRSPCPENYPADAHTGADNSVLEWASPACFGLCIWMHLVNGTGNSPSLGKPTPE